MGKETLNLQALWKIAREDKAVALGKPPPIPCKGYEINTPDQHEYDCSYAYAGDVTCDDCVVNGGRYDPRTGKKYVDRRKRKK